MQIVRVDFIDGTDSWINNVRWFSIQWSKGYAEICGSNKKGDDVKVTANLNLVTQIVSWEIEEEIENAGMEDKFGPDLSDDKRVKEE